MNSLCPNFHISKYVHILQCFGSEQDLSDVSDVSDDERRSRKKRVSGRGSAGDADGDTTLTEQPLTVQAVTTPPPQPPPPPPVPQYQSR